MITPIVLQKKVDYATHGFPPATVDQFKAEGIRIARPPVYSGYGAFFNLGSGRSSRMCASGRPSPTSSTAPRARP